jgi:hypothetical protein
VLHVLLVEVEVAPHLASIRRNEQEINNCALPPAHPRQRVLHVLLVEVEVFLVADVQGVVGMAMAEPLELLLLGLDNRFRDARRKETDDMLSAIEVILPIGQQEWERVVKRHVQYYPQNQRDAASLRRKFQQLYNTAAPTGDPNIPAAVLRAKAICNNLETRADTATLCYDLSPEGNIAVGDMGFPDNEEEVIVNNQQLDNVSNNGGDELDGSVSGTQQEVGSIRCLREVSLRPLVRPQASAGRATVSNATADSVQAMVLAMVCWTQREGGLEAERREERLDEQRRYDVQMELQREETRQQMEAQRQQMEAQCKERCKERREER